MVYGILIIFHSYSRIFVIFLIHKNIYQRKEDLSFKCISIHLIQLPFYFISCLLLKIFTVLWWVSFWFVCLKSAPLYSPVLFLSDIILLHWVEGSDGLEQQFSMCGPWTPGVTQYNTLCLFTCWHLYWCWKSGGR